MRVPSSGRRPYQGDSIGTLLGAMADEQVASAPANATVPRSLRRALLQGLAAEPDERWPSMEALLDELRSLVAPRRRREQRLGILTPSATSSTHFWRRGQVSIMA